MSNRRRRIWIDRLQTYLFLRMVAYCVILLVGLLAAERLGRHLFAAVEYMTGSGWNLFYSLPVNLTLVCLLAIYVVDMLRFTHRFAGPIYRFRKTIQAISRGEPVDLVRLRKGDFLTEMRDEFNEMLKALEERGLVVVKSEDEKSEQEAPQPVG